MLYLSVIKVYKNECITSSLAFSFSLSLVLIAQNQWIRESLFDGHGNYLYCHECILGLGSQRLVHQRRIKQELSQHTMVTKSKREVTELKLEKFVTLPSDDTNFQDWWKELDDDNDVEVRYPHKQHGLRVKLSNRAKTDVMNDFLRFVDNNSTPNGRQADYFLPKFKRIQPPKPTEKDFDHEALSCLVNEFVRKVKENLLMLYDNS